MASLVDESIITDFVAESREHLDAIEPDLLAMERGGADLPKELLNRVFRAIHSIKGGAGFLAFEALKRLSHALEGVLMQVRDGKLGVDPDLMDAVFAGLDKLRAMLDDIRASDGIACADEIGRFQAILERQGVAQGATVTARTPPAGPGPKRAFDLDREAVRSALRHGMNLFRATAYLHRDIRTQGITPLAFLKNALSVGQVLDAFIDLEQVAGLDRCLEQDLPVTILFGSVLDAELAALALKLPPAQIEMLDMPALRRQIKKPAAAVPEPAPAAAPRPGPQPRAAEPAADTLRVRVDLLTDLMNKAGELVLSRNQLLRALEGRARNVPGLAAILQNISQVTSELQEGIMQTRMQPVGTVFNRFPRIIRDLARQLGKQIEIDIEGAEVELDKTIVELLADPLTHIIRNGADHAIEPPEERLRLGKPATGKIRLRALHQGGQVLVSVSDDGRGIDAQKVLAKALAQGVVTEAQARELSEREIVDLVFAPGLSTAAKVSDVSGRGVGMDVVRANTEQLGGHVELESRPGKGTTVLLRLPLTLAIIPSMIVGVAGQRFAIPQVNVVEFVSIRPGGPGPRLERVHGAEVLCLRDRILPLVRLGALLGLPGPAAPPEATDLVVLRLGPNRFAVAVDTLFDIEEIVVKPLASFVKECRCCAGATILGDGRVIMILDAGGLAAAANLRFADLQEEERRRAEEERSRVLAAASRRRAVLVCAGAQGEFFAIPQDQVMRLERVRAADVQHVGERRFVDYRGRGLPLLRLDRLLEVGPVDPGLPEFYLVIPKAAGDPARPRAGIVISDIVDALDVDVDLEPARVPGPGILGAAVLQRHYTLFLDPQALMQAAGLQEEVPA